MLLVKKNVVEDESRLGTVKEASEAAAPGKAIRKLGEPTNRCSAALALKEECPWPLRPLCSYASA
jgi:hypothetical protein